MQDEEWKEALERLRQWETVEAPDIAALLRKYGAGNSEEDWFDSFDPESSTPGP